MSEMIIEVDFPTSQSVQALQHLVQSLEAVETSTKAADEQIETAELALKETGEAAVKSSRSVSEMAQAYGLVGKAAKTTSEELDKTGQAAEKAGDEMKAAGEKGAKAMKEAEKDTTGLGVATDKLAENLKGMAASYLSLNMAIRVLKELEDRTKAVMEARQMLAGEKLDLDSQIQPLLLNLGLQSNQGNQDKVRALAMEFQKRVGNKDVGLTTEILSAFANNGFDVSDAKSEGFKMAVETGIFAQRTGMSGDAAKEMARTANLTGAKTANDVDKLIAQTEAGFRGTSIPHSSEYMKAAIEASASATTQGVPVSQSLGLLAASSVGNVGPSVAASRIGQYNAALNPSEEQFRGRFGKRAYEAGIINDADVARGAARFRELNPTYDADRERSEIQAADNAKRSQDRYERQRDEAARANAKEEEAIADQSAKLDVQEHHPRTRNRAMAAAEMKAGRDSLAQRRIALAERKKEQVASIDDLKNRAQDAKRTQQVQKADADHKLQMQALGYAIAEKPLAQRQMLPFQLTEGKSPEETKRILSEFMSPALVEELMPMFGAGPRANMKQVIAQANAAKPEETRAANLAYSTTTLADASATEAAGQQADVNSVAAGGEYAKKTLDAAAKQVNREQAAGNAPVGYVSTTFDAKDATTQIEGQQAKQAVRILSNDMLAFWDSMTPAQKARHPEVKALIDKFRSVGKGEKTTFSTALGAAEARPEKARRMVQSMAEAFGAIRQAVKNEALQGGEHIPVGTDLVDPNPSMAPGSTLPLPPGAKSTGQLFDERGQSHPAAAGSHGPVSINNYHYTQHVGGIYGGGGDESPFAPPGRLEGFG